MTILFLISSEGYYGVENMLVTLGRHLLNQGCHCVVGVFCNSHNPHTEIAEHSRLHGLAVEFVPCRGKWDWAAVTQVRNLLVKYDVDVLHCHGYKADLYGYGAAVLKRVGLVATSHNWTGKSLNARTYAALDCLVLARFDEVVVVSDTVGATLRRWGVAATKLSTIRNGVDVEHFYKAAPLLRKEIGAESQALVGFVGRLVSEKGGAFLIRAAQQVIALHPHTKLILVGEGPAKREWEELASQLGITEHVVFVGVRKDMLAVYGSLDMVVLPSLLEALPLCLLEAMASGRPVIATRVGAVPQLINSEVTGLLVEPGDVNGLAAAILRLLRDRELASRLGENGRAHVARHYSAEEMARRYIGKYERVTQALPRLNASKAAWR